MTPSARDEFWMQKALELAQSAYAQNEVPVGAVLVLNDELIASGCNQPISSVDPSAHAEVIALRAGAKQLGNYRLLDTTLYVTLEPCLMCVGAMVHARIKNLVYGAFDPRAGVVSSCAAMLDLPFLNHRVQHVGGVMGEVCGGVLREFFRERR